MKPMLLLVAVALAADAQTVVEHAVATAAGAKAAAAARGVGKAAGSILEGARQRLQAAGKPGAAGAAPAATATPKIIEVTVASADAPKPAPAVEYADPALITVGLERAELLRKFGEPSMKTIAGDGAETWFYTPSSRDGAVVTVRDGKVAAVSPAPKPKKAAAAVVIVQ